MRILILEVLEADAWPMAPPTRSPTWLNRRAWPRSSPHAPHTPHAPSCRWGLVYGELLTLNDPETRLPAIDHLEGFLPDRPSLYRRVLVPSIIHGAAVPAWLYASGRPPDRHARLLLGSRWR